MTGAIIPLNIQCLHRTPYGGTGSVQLINEKATKDNEPIVTYALVPVCLMLFYTFEKTKPICYRAKQRKLLLTRILWQNNSYWGTKKQSQTKPISM
jgi:hypothetical protein